MTIASTRWPWYVAGPAIGLFVPALLIAGEPNVWRFQQPESSLFRRPTGPARVFSLRLEAHWPLESPVRGRHRGGRRRWFSLVGDPTTLPFRNRPDSL